MHILKCKILYAIYTVPVLLWYRINGVIFRGLSYFAGIPYIVRNRKSVISIGRGCRFMSVTWGNLIGLNHGCILSSTGNKSKIIIGENCSFSGCTLWCFKEIVLGNNVRCGANSIIIDGDAHQDDPRAGENSPIYIGDNVWIGMNVHILKGVSIGENSIIGAGSIVTKNIPANVIAAGIPCKVVREIDQNIINKLKK